MGNWQSREWSGPWSMEEPPNLSTIHINKCLTINSIGCIRCWSHIIACSPHKETTKCRPWSTLELWSNSWRVGWSCAPIARSRLGKKMDERRKSKSSGIVFFFEFANWLASLMWLYDGIVVLGLSYRISYLSWGPISTPGAECWWRDFCQHLWQNEVHSLRLPERFQHSQRWWHQSSSSTRDHRWDGFDRPTSSRTTDACAGTHPTPYKAHLHNTVWLSYS